VTRRTSSGDYQIPAGSSDGERVAAILRPELTGSQEGHVTLVVNFLDALRQSRVEAK
jgi:hypothetical protein